MELSTEPVTQRTTKPHSKEERRLFELFQKHAFLVRHPPEKKFKLASGGESYRYFDCKIVTHNPEGIALIAKIIFDRISDYPKVDAIGGLETGAIPIAVAVSQLSYFRNRPIPAFFVRQEKKTHGTEKWVEGNLPEGSKVVIVDDVTTKGGSVQKAVDRVRELGCEILEIITLVDRGEGAAERFREYTFTPIFKMSEFGSSE